LITLHLQIRISILQKAMGLFSRRQCGAVTTDTPKPTHHHQNRGPIVMDMSTRPSFGQWLKVTWLDLATMVVMGIIGLGVYEAHPAPSRSFPVYFQDGEIVYPQFAYPLRKEIVPICMFISGSVVN
jgi:diacylglycerol diphosphate phosphatase/phosphatidate phosphatase